MSPLTRFSIRRPRTALVAWAAVAVCLALVGLGVEHSLSPSVTVAPGTESSRAQRLATHAFGPSVLVPILLEGPARQLDRQGPQLVRALSRRPDTRVMSAWSAGASGAALRPRPGAAMIVASVARTERAMVDTVQPKIERTVHAVVRAPVRAHVTGQPTLDRALRSEAIAATRRGLLIACGVLFLLLLIGLRTPVAAGVLTAFGALGTLAAMGVMSLLGAVIDTDALAVALGAITGLALGVGFALMIVDRFHEEETAHSAERVAAAATAAATAGRAVLFSGAAVVVALVLATAIAPTTILTSLGIGVLLCAASATFAAVVVMPAVLVLLGPRISALRFPAPPLLAGAWNWLAGRGRWVTRRPVAAGALATAAMALLAVPALSLETGPPDISLLPASSTARQDFERVATVMGPGWPTPYNVLVVSNRHPVTAAATLGSIAHFQAHMARDRRVDSVVGPGAFQAQSRQLEALPRGLRDSAKLLKGGKRDLGRLQRGLGLAGTGANQLRSGLGDAAAGAGQLHSGSRRAQSGAGQLHTGLQTARAGAGAISTGLDQALGGARSLRQGAIRALAGSAQLAGGVSQAAAPVRKGLPVFQQLATNIGNASGAVKKAQTTASASSQQASSALAALENMSSGKQDPSYDAAVQAVRSAQADAASVDSQLTAVAPALGGAALVSDAAAKQVGELSVGLGKLTTGSTQLEAGIAQLRNGNAELASGIARLAGGGGQLTTGVGRLRDGAAALEAGLSQLTTGAGKLQGGLSGGVGPAGQLSGGLGTLEAGVAKFRGQLPSTRDIERLQRQSPGLFDSGYFVLAAIEGAPPAQRALASFAVNLTRGGNAGQIVVVPAQAANAPATVQLGHDLTVRADRLAAATGAHVAVGGPAGDLADVTSRANDRLPWVIVALAAAVALVLMIALRAVILPLVAVACDLLVALATFGAMQLLFGGANPVLGGPGYLDPMSVIGIFAAIFGITSVYEILLLTRTRERFLETGDAREALSFGLRRTAAVATGVAAVMIAAALPFVFGDLINVRQFGVGIAVAVALDGLIVRPVLLPAATALLGPRSWWPTRVGAPPGRVPETPATFGPTAGGTA